MFHEEPLGIPASEGYGYLQGGPGQVLGPKPGFRIESKLDIGRTASLWLARDLCKDQFVAIKILAGYTSQLNRENKLQELRVLRRLSDPAPPAPGGPSAAVGVTLPSSSPFVTQLLSYFYHPGAEGDGEHLCLVMELLCSDVLRIRSRLPDAGYLPLPTVKRILKHVIQGIAHAHSRGIVHTDIKLDNILVAPSDIRIPHAVTDWPGKNPLQAYPPTQSLSGMVTSFISSMHW
ncbi:Serine/threonine-protein kinase SRPK1 [Termitomyces sp. T112]|nr:Serine/threonine-protein kinase SRPK1 [Termitomyces sp. T112]KAH0585132.1 hypothetical protein H2248_008391 [Termitomyces sp. 'cryptogamus']KNZ81900.1 Serine/threonine-protein kinase SRPK1 [Termitomyces sp. J132]